MNVKTLGAVCATGALALALFAAPALANDPIGGRPSLDLDAINVADSLESNLEPAVQIVPEKDVDRLCRGRFAVRPLRLQISHSSDNESSFQDPNTLEPKLLNYAAVARGLRFAALENGYVPLHITVGDHTIPGPFYQASTEVEEYGSGGIGDIEAYNSMRVRANGMGNHEFDAGIDDFSRMLERARYPFVAVNLDFTNAQVGPEAPEIEIGEDRGFARPNAGKVVKSTILRVFSNCVALIGRAPADFFNVIKDPDNTIPGIDFVGGRDPETNQPLVSAIDQVLEEVDRLEDLGVNKIFLLDHAQDFTGDPLSANRLRGIDVIIAAGSTGFMAKPEANGPFNLLRDEDSAEANYPTVREDSLGNDVLVINSDQQYRYVGNLMITFDENGFVTDVDDRSGPIATTEEAVDLLAQEIGFDELRPWRGVQNVWDKLQATSTIQDAFTVVGTTTAPLNGNRADVRSRETNLGRLAADSTLWFPPREFPNIDIDVALKNGGGIRDSITGPNIIRLTIGAALAFDNKLAILELTGDQLLATMENSVSRANFTDGRFPQIAGMYMEFDTNFAPLEGLESVTTPSRVRTLRITRANGQTDVLVENGVALGDLSRTFVMATNDFLSTGGDGYAALAAATKLETTSIGEQQILEDYIVDELNGTVDLPEPLDGPRVVRLSE
jgi:2',3'-cyclic-nucleotide 2'-phosphodiesterase (5'-nucleotidase family)